MKAIFAFVIFALWIAILQPAGASIYDPFSENYVNDGAQIMSSGAKNEIEAIVKDFYKESDVVIMIETVKDAADIQKLGRERFKANILDSKAKGTRELNMLILYSKNSKKKSEFTIVHADKCGLESEKINSVLNDQKMRSEINSGNYDEGFKDAILLLKKFLAEKVKSGDFMCTVYGEPGLEFSVNPAIFAPPSKENPIGKGLDRKLNPYDDGIVTVYDPLVCKLYNAGDLKEVELTVTTVKKTIKRKVKCENGECSLYLNPEEIYLKYKIREDRTPDKDGYVFYDEEGRGYYERGTKISCSALVNNKKLSSELTVAMHVLIFMNIQNSYLSYFSDEIQEKLDDAKDQYEYYLLVSGANENPKTTAKPVFIRDKTIRDFDKNTVFKKSDEFAEKIITNLYKGNSRYDICVLLINTNIYDSSFTSSRTINNYVVVLRKGNVASLAHELGHSLSFLCDEYLEAVWENQRREYEFSMEKNGIIQPIAFVGCVNTYPDCCKESWNGDSCIKPSLGEIDRCSGMPYNNQLMPDPKLGLNAPKYSIMGACARMEKNKLIYPFSKKYLQRSCNKCLDSSFVDYLKTVKDANLFFTFTFPRDKYIIEVEYQ